MAIQFEEINDKNKKLHKTSSDPFPLYGKLEVTYNRGKWEHAEVLFEKTRSKAYEYEAIDVEDFINSEDKTVFYAIENGDLLGQVTIRKNWNNYCYIQDIGVKTKARRKNIGTKLLGLAKEWAEERNLHGFMLETQDINLTACRFYLKNGFHLGGVDVMLYHHLESKDERALFWYKNF